MKRYAFPIILIFLIIVSLAVLSKLVQLSRPIEVTDDSDSLTLDSSQKIYEEFDLEKASETSSFYAEETTRTTHLKAGTELSAQTLRKYAQAFVSVQSYMERSGSNANYNDTSKIVNSCGLSVADYTRISTQMNKSALFHEEVQKLIHEIQEAQ